MFEDVLKETGTTSDIKTRINMERIQFLRYRMECNTILMGRKEYKEFCEEVLNLAPDIDPETGSEMKVMSLKIVKVDKDSYLSGAYVLDEEDLMAKRIESLTKNSN